MACDTSNNSIFLWEFWKCHPNICFTGIDHRGLNPEYPYLGSDEPFLIRREVWHATYQTTVIFRGKSEKVIQISVLLELTTVASIRNIPQFRIEATVVNSNKTDI